MAERFEDEFAESNRQPYRLAEGNSPPAVPERPVRSKRRRKQKNPKAVLEKLALRISHQNTDVPTSAVYRHVYLGCGGCTEVDDWDFLRVTDPFELGVTACPLLDRG